MLIIKMETGYWCQGYAWEEWVWLLRGGDSITGGSRGLCV